MNNLDLIGLKSRQLHTPCNGCTLCCHNDLVRIYHFENPNQWEVSPHPNYPGQWMLAHKANGDCYYLGEEGCTIQSTKPYMCRTMDCRLLALRIPYDLAMVNKGINMDVWRKGKELLKQTDKKTLKKLKRIAKK